MGRLAKRVGHVGGLKLDGPMDNMRKTSMAVSDSTSMIDRLLGSDSEDSLNSSDLSEEAQQYDVNSWNWDIKKLQAEDTALSISSPLSSSGKSSRRTSKSSLARTQKSLELSMMESEAGDENIPLEPSVIMSPMKPTKHVIKSSRAKPPKNDLTFTISTSQRPHSEHLEVSMDPEPSLVNELPSDDLPAEGDKDSVEGDDHSSDDLAISDDDPGTGGDQVASDDELALDNVQMLSDDDLPDNNEVSDDSQVPEDDNMEDDVDEPRVDTPKVHKVTKKIRRSSLSKLSRKGRRRQTLFLIEKAQKAGFAPEGSENSEGDEGVRRSKRRKGPPLKFWKNERHIYKRSNDGLGAVLPVSHGDFVRSDDETDQMPKKKRSRKVKKSNNALADTMVDIGRKKKTFLNIEGEEGEVSRYIVGLSQGTLEFQDLGDESNSKSIVKAAKCFDTEDFTNGVIIIPPGHFKEAEHIVIPEVFQVNVCPGSSLAVTINKETFKFSTGDNFWIPPGSVYSLKNESKTNSIELSFFVPNYEVSSAPRKPKKRMKSTPLL